MVWGRGLQKTWLDECVGTVQWKIRLLPLFRRKFPFIAFDHIRCCVEGNRKKKREGSKRKYYNGEVDKQSSRWVSFDDIDEPAQFRWNRRWSLFGKKRYLSIRDENSGRRIIKKNEVFFEHYIKMKIWHIFLMILNVNIELSIGMH